MRGMCLQAELGVLLEVEFEALRLLPVLRPDPACAPAPAPARPGVTLAAERRAAAEAPQTRSRGWTAGIVAGGC